MTQPDPYSLLPVMVLDAGVVRDIADALDGRWDPGTEVDGVRTDQLIAAARLRLYGERTRAGWYIVTHREARRSGQSRGDADWTVGFLPDMSTFDDSPAKRDVDSLVKLYLASGIDAERCLTLAYCVLYEPVRFLVTNNPISYRHRRDFDLPERLELLTPERAVNRMRLADGEKPFLAPPPDSALAAVEPWWIP